jgi:hypothetical protein
MICASCKLEKPERQTGVCIQCENAVGNQERLRNRKRYKEDKPEGYPRYVMNHLRATNSFADIRFQRARQEDYVDSECTTHRPGKRRHSQE